MQVEEEEEEQCSPVSVLDRPFEDDDRHADDDDGDNGIDRFDLECTYAFGQSTFSLNSFQLNFVPFPYAL